MIGQQRTAVHRLAQRIANVRTSYDIDVIRSHAESIYNIAARHESRLSDNIMTRRRHQRCPQRMSWVAERMQWKLIQDDCRLIVDSAEGVRNEP